MSRTFPIPNQVKVELSVPGEVVDDVDVFFLRYTFLVFFGVVGGVGDESSGVKLWISQTSHASLVEG